MGSLIRLGFFKSNGVAATPGYFIADTPVFGVKTETSWGPTEATGKQQGSGYLAGGFLRSEDGVQNNENTRDHWFSSGTYKYASVYVKNINGGIISVQLDGVAQGTIDQYAAAEVANSYSELTGLSVTQGLKVWKHRMATKNASSTDYIGRVSTAAFVRTGA